MNASKRTLFICCVSLVLMVLSTHAHAGYWKRVGLGEISETPASWREGNFVFTIHSATRNSYDATFAGTGVATRATIVWADPPDILREGELAPVSGEVKNAVTGGGFGTGSLALVFDVPGMSLGAVSGSQTRLMTIGATGSKTMSDVPMPKQGSGKWMLYYWAGFGQRTMMQVSYQYEYVAGPTPASVATPVALPPTGGYWKRTGLGTITETPASWREGNFVFTIHSATRNSYDATFAGTGVATRATIVWADPPDILREGELAPVSGEVKNAVTGGGFGTGSLALVFDVPGMSLGAVSGSQTRLMTIGATGSKTMSDVPMPKQGSGKWMLYYWAGFGQRTMMQVAFPYEYVPIRR